MRISIWMGLVVMALALAAPARAVDGVIEINQQRAEAGNVTPGDAAGFPVTLDTSGSYRLTGDLLVPDGQSGIRIEADDVTLDLNGFAIRAAGATVFADGVLVSVQNNVEIRGGTIADFGRHGIFGLASSDVRVIDVRVFRNAADGMNLETVSGGGSLVQRCHVVGSGGIGVRVLGTGGLVLDNVIRNNAGLGLFMAGLTQGYGQNVLTGNNGAGAEVSGGQAIACNLLEGAFVCPP